MTVALNYAAAAVVDLRRTLHIYKPIDRERIVALIAQIERSVHFSVPENGNILDDGWKGLRDSEVRLPFPEITIEYRVSDQKAASYPDMVPAPRRLIIASMVRTEDLAKATNNYSKIPNGVESEWLIMVNAACDFDRGYGWVPMAGAYCIHCTGWDNYEGKTELMPSSQVDPTVPGVAGFVMVFLPGMATWLMEKLGDDMEKLWRTLGTDVGAETSTTMELCEALSCTNVGLTTIQSAKPGVNVRRVRDGKLPLYEIKTLEVKVPGEQHSGAIGRSYSDRASPRQHLRRGHIRRLADGRKLLIPSCVVGKDGLIEKTYRINKLGARL